MATRKLPPHMLARTYTNKHGKVWTGYYYRGRRDEEGRRREIPLGSDLSIALRKWAEIEGKPVQADNALHKVYAKYIEWAENRAVSGLALRTISDYKKFWKFLAKVFRDAPIDAIQPSHLLRYFDARESKIRAKLEVRFLSTLFNWAKARGYANGANPVTGITRQMKAPSRRTIYVTDTDFALVHKHAVQFVKDAMDIALLTGQRPADVFKMRWDDIEDGVLTVKQNKTGNVVRISVEGRLKEVLDRIRMRPYINPLIVNNRGRSFGARAFLRAFTDARDKAEVEAKEMCITFNRFQFKDIRAKAATDSASQTEAQKLLGHSDAATTVIYRRDKGEVIKPLKTANGG